jgi:hypothetical protein
LIRYLACDHENCTSVYVVFNQKPGRRISKKI